MYKRTRSMQPNIITTLLPERYHSLYRHQTKQLSY